MAVAVVQVVGTGALEGTGGPDTQVQVSVPSIAAGSRLLAFHTRDVSNNATVTITGGGGTWLSLGYAPSPSGTGDGNGEEVGCWYNDSPTTGTQTVNFNFSGSGEQVTGGVVVELSGAAGGANWLTNHQQQTAPGTGTDAVGAAATVTPTAARGRIVGCGFNSNTNGAPNAGTTNSPTSHGTFWSWFFSSGTPLSARVQSHANAGTSAVASTFTCANSTRGAEDHISWTVWVPEPASGSAPSSAPTLAGGATGASLAAAAASSAPTLAGGATGASLSAGVPSSAPTLSGAATGASKAAAAASSAPTLTADGTTSSGSTSAAASSAPTLAAAVTGASLKAAAASCAPSLSADAEGNATGSRVYPLVDHSSGRYFTNQLGEPTPMLEDMNQVVTGHLSQPDISTYLAWLKANGFNTIRHFAFTQGGAGTFAVVNEPNDFYGNVPFSTANDFSTFSGSSAYAKNLQKFWGKCNALEIMVNLFTTYLGFNGSPANQGWHEHWTDSANTNTVAFNLGAALATLAQPYPNVNLWLEGDYTSSGTVLARMQNLVAGWQSVMRTRLAGSEPAPPNNVPTAVQTGFGYGTNPATTDQQIQSYYAAGSGANGQGYVEFDSAYDASPTMPTYPTDSPSYNNLWSGGVLSSRKDTRRMRLQVLACGGIRAGHFFADDDRINTASPSGILATLTDVASADGALANALVRSLPHFLFRPSGTGTDHAGRTLIGTGIGTGNQKIQASMTSDGAYLLVYVPRTDTTSAVTFEVDLRGMNADPIRARWWNPTTGAFSTNGSAAGTYSLANSASAQSFTTPGDNATSSGDWVLLLDTTGSPAAANSAPTLSAAATSLGAGQAVPSSAPTLTAGATASARSAGDASCAPSLTAAATTQGGSAAVAAPTLSAGAAGAALVAAASSSAPTLSGGATGAAAFAGVPSCAPSFNAAPVGAVLYAAAPSSAPSLTAGATSALGPWAQSAPTMTAGATSSAKKMADASSAPSLFADASAQFNNIPSGGGKWHPDYYQKGWIPDYFGG